MANIFDTTLGNVGCLLNNVMNGVGSLISNIQKGTTGCNSTTTPAYYSYRPSPQTQNTAYAASRPQNAKQQLQQMNPSVYSGKWMQDMSDSEAQSRLQVEQANQRKQAEYQNGAQQAQNNIAARKQMAEQNRQEYLRRLNSQTSQEITRASRENALVVNTPLTFAGQSTDTTISIATPAIQQIPLVFNS